MVNIILYVIYGITNILGVTLLKQALNNLKSSQHVEIIHHYYLFAAVGAILYIISFCTWFVILSRLKLIIAYPLCISISLVGSTLAAVLFLQETISLVNWIGLIFVVGGAIAINL